MMDTAKIKFDANGLVPVIVQDYASGKVLMTAWANAESLRLSEERGEMVFWSRSRKEIWHKGATSGNFLKIRSIKVDCDGDALLALVDALGPACHTGERSCFYENFYSAPGGTPADDVCSFLGELERYLKARRHDSPEESYTARLFAKGNTRIAQKVGEEGLETALALATGDRENFRYEAADLLYHLLVACIAADMPFTEVLAELASRHAKK